MSEMINATSVERRLRDWGDIEHNQLGEALYAGADAIATLKKLTNEVTAMLGVAEQSMRESAGHTNVAVLIQRRDEARALLARCEETR